MLSYETAKGILRDLHQLKLSSNRLSTLSLLHILSTFGFNFWTMSAPWRIFLVETGYDRTLATTSYRAAHSTTGMCLVLFFNVADLQMTN